MVTHSSILAWRIQWNRGAWRATVHRVAKSQARVRECVRTCTHTHTLTHTNKTIILFIYLFIKTIILKVEVS